MSSLTELENAISTNPDQITISQFLSTIKNVISDMEEKKDESEMKKISTLMKWKNIQYYIQYLINMGIEGKELDENQRQNLYLIIYILQSIYNYSGLETGVSDSDYDRLYELLNQEGEDLVSTPIVSGNVRHHRYRSLRGTLEKVYSLTEEDKMANKSRKSLDQWLDEKERMLYEKTGEHYDLHHVPIYVFPKWDGVSIIFEFNEKNELEYALTRGNTDTNEAQDVTFVFAPIQSRIKDKQRTGYPYGLKTEVMMTITDLGKCNRESDEEYKNTRSVISSIVNGHEVDDRINYLDVVRLRTSTLNADGTETLQELASNAFQRPYLVCNMDNREAIKKFAYDHTFVDGLRCDGAVIYIQDENLRKLLGRKNHKNQYEVAFKFNEEIAHTKITGITFSVTPFGNIFPVANFEVRHMKGNAVQNVSLGSIARFNELHLAVGDSVKILYEIIPYLVYDENDPKCNRSGNTPIPLPEFCPECGHSITYNEKRTAASCTNPDCSCRKRGKLLNYATKLGLDWFGEETINTLYEADILTDITDFYKLPEKHDQIVALDKFGETKYQNLVESVIKNGTRISADKFMGAIGIENIGAKTFAKIFERYTILELLEFADDMKVSKLSDIPGIADITAAKILKGIKAEKKMIKKLIEKYVFLYFEAKSGDAKFIAVFHKIRSKLLTEKMKAVGGEVEDNLTKKTSFLIVPNDYDGNSSTGEKARKYDCPIVKIDDVPEYVQNKFGLTI